MRTRDGAGMREDGLVDGKKTGVVGFIEIENHQISVCLGALDDSVEESTPLARPIHDRRGAEAFFGERKNDVTIQRKFVGRVEGE